jgi:predicted kinase
MCDPTSSASRLAGLAADTRSHSQVDSDLYTPERTAHTYARLQQCAAECLRGRRTVLVDATFLQQSQRAAFHALAAAQGVPVLSSQCAHVEAWTPEEGRNLIEADTTDADVVARVSAAIHRRTSRAIESP